MIKLLIIAVSATVLFSATLYAQPSINDPVILDDFEDRWGGIPSDNNLSGVIVHLFPNLAYCTSGFWYTFNDLGGSLVLSGNLSDTINDANHNIDSIVGKDANGNHYLHIILKTSISQADTSYAGFGNVILWSKHVKDVDLSALKVITMKVKGNGSVILRFRTEDISDTFLYTDSYQYKINLPVEWQQIAIPACSLKAPVNSVPFNLGWTWDGAAGGKNTGKKKVQNIIFEVENHKDAELYIDDIEFDGMVYNDFIQQVSTKKYTHPSTKRPFSMTENSIIYTTEKTEHVCVSVFSIRGEKIIEINEQKSAGTYKCNLAALHQNTLPAGMYIFQISIGLKKWQITHSLVNKTR